MPNTYTQLYIQFVFAVKHRQALIQPAWKTDLYKYITGIVQGKKSKLLAINGMSDHIHIFIGYNPIISIPDLVKDIKLASNNWVNEAKLTKQRFGWQEGYGAFSYSRSLVHDVSTYIEKQEIHHKKKTFGEEYVAFLKAFEVAYDEKYLFEFFDNVCSTPAELERR
ncbi:MAG: IS200/IS605 family transposase [Bacteroidota bacterium]|nr:IS200/IS605 family transposase [Bacteroidota bacterium]